MICPSRLHPLSAGLLLYQSCAVCLSLSLTPPHPLLPPGLPHTSSNNENLLQVFSFFFFFPPALALWDKQAIDESSIMHGLTGTDSTRPTVNMCRQDRISVLAVRRCIYLPLTQTHNSTEPQLPRLRGADNTCKQLHSKPLPAHKYSWLFFTHRHCLDCTSFTSVCNTDGRATRIWRMCQRFFRGRAWFCLSELAYLNTYKLPGSNENGSSPLHVTVKYI